MQEMLISHQERRYTGGSQRLAPHRRTAMATVSSEESKNPATCLTDDLIVEILSRLPVKSVCRFKCVSKHWLDLISHPDHRKKLPQTLAGFFYDTYSSERFPEMARHFTNVTGRGAPLIRPSLSFLPGHADIDLVDCCNGLLLCRSPTTATGANRYIVCNPVTEEWVALPESTQVGNVREARLGFDPAVSPNFYVFEFVEDTDAEPGYGFYVSGLEIYSSETRQWAHRENGWGDGASLYPGMSTVFLNGFLHVFASGPQYVMAVDTKGNTWRIIPVPDSSDEGFIGHSLGHLYYLNTVEEHNWELSVYALEDYASDEWIFKHSVRISKLLGMSSFDRLQHYNLITIHPECHLIFFVSDLDQTIRCYDMDSRKVCVIRSIGCPIDYNSKRCLSYVPLFSNSLASWN